MANSFTVLQNSETIGNIIESFNALTEDDYNNEKCANFWTASVCARAVSECYHKDMTGTTQAQMKSAYAHGFFTCSGHTEKGKGVTM